MWIAPNHSLCYYSLKENKRLVLIDALQLTKAQIKEVTGLAKQFAFSISLRSEDDEDAPIESHYLAADKQEDLGAWLDSLAKAGSMDVIVTYHLGSSMAEDVKAYRLLVKNRRLKVTGDAGSFEPLFKAKLWKLKSGGDPAKPGDWFERDMWTSRNGSLVYYSPKDGRDLVYYTSADVAGAKVHRAPDGRACRPFAFTVELAPADGVLFDPGEFAAESEEMRSRWMEALSSFQGP